MNWEKYWNYLIESGTQWGMKLLGVLIAFYIGKLIARAISRTLVRQLERREFDPTLTKFFGNLTRYGIIAAVAIGCLGVFGIETTSFAALLGAAGLAIGLALKGTLSHFASGVMLLIFRPFEVNDLVKAGGELGTVQSIDLFTTELCTLDNRQLIIPNGEIFGKTIENLTGYDIRRVDVDVGVAYEHEIDDVQPILERAAAAVELGLSDPPPQIFLKELGASSVDWQVRVWCTTADYWDVRQEIIRQAKAALDGAKLTIPFPQLDVHFDPAVVTNINALKAS